MKYFYVSVLLLSSLAAEGQIPAARMTLEQATQLAEEQNPAVRAAIRRLSVLQAKEATTGFLDDPMVMYRNWGTPLTEPWNWNQSQHMFQIQRTFTSKDRRRLDRSAAENDALTAENEVEAVRQEIGVQVKKSFNMLLRTADELRLNERQAELLRESLGAALAKYTVGKTPQADVLRAQILLTRLEEQRIALQTEAEVQRAELNTLMNRAPDRTFEPVGLYRTPDRLPSLPELEQMAQEHRPELAALRSKRKAEADRIQKARLAYRPDYTVGGGYMIMPESSGFRNAYMAEVSVNLPWWNRAKHDTETHAAITEGEATEAELAAQQSAVLLEIQLALVRLNAAQRTLKLYGQTLAPQAEANLKASLAAYENDRAEFLNLVDSQNLLLDVETNRLKAAAEVDARIAELERAIGFSLPTTTQPPMPGAEEIRK